MSRQVIIRKKLGAPKNSKKKFVVAIKEDDAPYTVRYFKSYPKVCKYLGIKDEPNE